MCGNTQFHEWEFSFEAVTLFVFYANLCTLEMAIH